ncbi:MAG: hypothetical protein M1522_01570 [Actinobacteria bacterium]|jgi:hypothetical protein|nr:hypothetical protein [Actinomycetota bacterium]
MTRCGETSFTRCPRCRKKGVQFHFAKVVVGEAGMYELVMGFKGEDCASTFYVARPAVARRDGFDSESDRGH